MKRNKYTVGIFGTNAIKTFYAWNSARKAIPTLIKSILKDGQSAKFLYFMPNFQVKKYGSETWQLSTGELILITTKAVDNAS
jgi:hypothetical protein